MIQHSFTGAYQSEVNARNQGINTITGGIKDAATLALGITGFAGGFGSSELGKTVAKGAEHTLAGRVGGVGGNIMLATLQQKKESSNAREDTKQLFSAEEVGQTIQSQLGDNPINRSAKKSLSTVFETLTKAKEVDVIDKEGNLNINKAGEFLTDYEEEDVQNAFNKIAEKAKTPEDFENLNNVWTKIVNARNKKKEKDIIVDVLTELKGE